MKESSKVEVKPKLEINEASLKPLLKKELLEVVRHKEKYSDNYFFNHNFEKHLEESSYRAQKDSNEEQKNEEYCWVERSFNTGRDRFPHTV